MRSLRRQQNHHRTFSKPREHQRCCPGNATLLVASSWSWWSVADHSSLGICASIFCGKCSRPADTCPHSHSRNLSCRGTSCGCSLCSLQPCGRNWGTASTSLTAPRQTHQHQQRSAASQGAAVTLHSSGPACMRSRCMDRNGPAATSMCGIRSSNNKISHSCVHACGTATAAMPSLKIKRLKSVQLPGRFRR